MNFVAAKGLTAHSVLQYFPTPVHWTNEIIDVKVLCISSIRGVGDYSYIHTLKDRNSLVTKTFAVCSIFDKFDSSRNYLEQRILHRSARNSLHDYNKINTE